MKGIIEDIDKPIPEDLKTGLFKKGRIRVIIIYEDSSFKEYHVLLKSNYFITIKNRNYIIIPEAIIKGKVSTMVYFFNNPYPIQFLYKRTNLTALQLRSKQEIEKLTEEQKILIDKVYIDSEALNSIFSSSLISNLYKENQLTIRMIIIILVIVAVIILVVLQATGKVDIVGMFASGKK